MKSVKSIDTYYKKIIDLILELHHTDFSTAGPGHCMKITGLGYNELDYLWDLLSAKHQNIDTFIISENDNESIKNITATKLIEFRNQQENPLLVLIPANSRTAAEDSYGNATFKEISLEGLESKLKKKLIQEIPSKYKRIIKEDIFKFLLNENLSNINFINYLISLVQEGYNKENIGNFIYHLNLIPDVALIDIEEKIRIRLNKNKINSNLLSSFEISIYDRVNELTLKPNTLQKELVDFIKSESDTKSITTLCYKIFSEYQHLNFSNWKIPDIDFSHVKLTTDELKSKNFKVEEGNLVLQAENNRNSKVKIKFSTVPNPLEISGLKYFKIILFEVDGGAGEEVTVLRKLKNTNSARPFREATVELDPNMIEEGSYFFKVLAEDEQGTILNYDDNFKDKKVQSAWEQTKKADENASKSQYTYKLTCDSEDFDFYIDEVIEKDETAKKHKLNNVLQAFYKYRVDQLKSGEEISFPENSENSNIWLKDNKERLASTFHVNYSDKHNYQINIATKLRKIENVFLEAKGSFGHVTADLNNNSQKVDFNSLQFIESDITSVVPNPILKLRKEIFTFILESNENSNGIFETADVFKIADQIKSYLKKLATWTSKLKKQISSNEIGVEEKSELQKLLTQLQILDVVKVKSKLPDGKPIEALLLSPLHPLHLGWNIQLLEVFYNWEQKTREFEGYIDSWSTDLNQLFNGQIFPEISPLTLVDPLTFTGYEHSGNLTFGWSLYLNNTIGVSSNNMTSISRQLKHYFRQLFNISKDNYVESDLSLKLIIRHFKNYLQQHPYTDKLIINLINAGDANIFADALVNLEKENSFKKIDYEIRIFKGDDKIIEHGEALRKLINPVFNITEEAESFSQPSRNRLFPKLRFSINNLDDYLKQPSKYTAHISFLVNPFPTKIELIKPFSERRNFYLNALIVDPTIFVEDDGNEIKWNRFIVGNKLSNKYEGTGEETIKLFENLQTFVSSALASKYTESIPATQLSLTNKDNVLLEHLHDHSDWVVTFDKNLGPQIFDQPSNNGKIPFLLDYIPGEEISGISSYLTTRPTSEILGLLGPHFEEFNLSIQNQEDEKKIKSLLEDVRAVSSSLVLQLNSSKNKAFEVIGTAFTKRILEKKGFLEKSFLIPIDLHQTLFDIQLNNNKSRADNLLVSLDPVKKEISVTVLEIKCRTSLGDSEKDDLKIKMKEQIINTIEVLRFHFDSEYNLSFDRLDRELKNRELKKLLSFYIDRAYRYEFLNEKIYREYSIFMENLDKGFKFKFNQLGIIFDFSAEKRHFKEVIDSDLTFFTFGGKLINEILDPDSDLNTRRLEENEFEDELIHAIGKNSKLRKFIQKFKPAEEPSPIEIDTKQIENVKPEPDVSSSENESQKQQDSTTVTDADQNKGDRNIRVHKSPKYDILIGKNTPSKQIGILGESIQGKKIAIDLSETNTISLFGIQGGGKSYTIGTISEMVLKQFNNINDLPSPLAGVIFHYSESMDYEPEFTSMIYNNDSKNELQKLKERYGAEPDNIEDVIILTPKDKIEERRSEYPSINVLPIAFNSKELNVQDWMFLLGAIGNDSTYVKQLKAIMKQNRRNLTLDVINQSVEESVLLSNSQKALARQKLSFAREYIDDSFTLNEVLAPGRLIIVDLRDEFIDKDEALGLFVIMLNIFSSVKVRNNEHFNKFIVFDEAHKYMDNKDLTGNIVTAIREMRHKGVSIMIASQDPPSLPNEIIELSSIVLLHKFNSPQWLKHVQKSITQLATLKPADMSSLAPGEGFLWATKATDKSISTRPVKVSTRPRVTKHGGGTIQATKS